jgi:hypothetical protein
MTTKKDKPFYEGKDKKPKLNNIMGSYYGGFSSRSNEIKKTEDIIANIEASSDGMVDMQSSQWYSPELTPDMWLMPKSRQETWRWVRLFYNLDPYVQSILGMHSLYPFSMFKVIAEDETVSKFYNQISFNRGFNLFEFILKMSLSYQKFGEAIVLGIKNDEKLQLKDKDIKFTRWDRFILFEPEYIEVRQAFFEKNPRYYLQISPEMRKEAKEAKNLNRLVDKNIDDLLKQNEILLENENVSSIMNLTDASALRGTSPIQCLLRVLMFQDKVSMLKLAAIDRFRYPIEIWKIGDTSLDPPKIPNKQELMEFEQFIKRAKNNAPFSLFVPPFVNYEVVGFGNQSSTYDYKDDYEWVRDSILVGLGVSKDLILGEVKGWTNTNQMTLQKLIMVYQSIRDKFENWMINNFYTPIAEANSFYTKNKDLDIPKIEWDKRLDLDRDETEDYKELWKDGLISTKTLFTKYKSLDIATEEINLKKEIGSVFDNGSRIATGGREKLSEEEIVRPESEMGLEPESEPEPKLEPESEPESEIKPSTTPEEPSLE